MSNVLLIEDQLSLLDSLQRGLREEGFQVLAASTAANAYRHIQREPLDAVVLDLMLPDGDGLDLLRRVRSEEFRKPIIVITAKDSVRDRVTGLDVGADDYLVKPFAFDELVARLRAVLRRSSSVPADRVLCLDDLALDVVTRRVIRRGQELDLTQRQYEVLEYLMRHKNRVVTREMLARDVWKASTATWTNVIEVQINQLRKKLTVPGAMPLLHTVRGEGYVLGERQ
ncbi:MAG: response regulator transcription factor [Planctomycetales bacterium]|nr:response regulator transcription factor [Planctomycetales bacterium]